MSSGSPVEVLGTDASLDELYRRHSDEAWRLAYSITRNPDDASDAVSEAFAGVLKALTGARCDTVQDVRPYLMAATRNAALDVVRGAGRVQPTDQPPPEEAAPGAGPSDRLVAGENRTHLAEALAGLPPRWRAVLWLTEVEGMPPREAAEVLHLTPNNVAQLATRARSRLRQRYVQSHVRNHASGDCAWTAEHLGGLATGELTEHRANRVRAHLAECDDCRARLAELDDLGLSLRRAAIPLALVLRRSRVPRWLEPVTNWFGRTGHLAGTVPDPAAIGAVGAMANLAGSPLGHGIAAAVTAGLLALGLGAAAVRQAPTPPPPAGPAAVEAAAPIAAVPLPPAEATTVPPVTDAQPSTTTTTTTAPDPPPAPAAAPTPPAPPVPAAAPAAFEPRGPLATATLATVATAVVPAVAVHDAPGGGVVRSLTSPVRSGAPLVLLVTEQRGDWLQVLLPVRPNGSTGWVRRDQVGLATHSFRILVELGAHRITVYNGTKVLLSAPIGVGRGNAPTPGGLFYITELIRPADAAGNYDPGGPYGPYAYPLSGFSEVLFDFAGGDGQFGIHGTDDPSALGRDVSSGCIRMGNDGITRLAGILPLGVPVEILP